MTRNSLAIGSAAALTIGAFLWALSEPRAQEPNRTTFLAGQGGASELDQTYVAQGLGEVLESTDSRQALQHVAEVNASKDGVEVLGALESGRPVRVVSASTSEPLGGALVTWMDATELGDVRVAIVDEMLAWVLIEGDPEQYMREEGRTFQADDEGRLYLPAQTGVAMARHGDLWLLRELRAYPSQEETLVLEPDTSLVVRVLDYLDEPALGIDVYFLESHGPSADSISWAVTDPVLGEARFPHFGAKEKARAKGLFGQAHPTNTLAIAPIVYTPEPILQYVDRGALPVGRLDLQLPPTGSIEIRAVYPNGEVVLDEGMRTDLSQLGLDSRRFPYGYVYDNLLQIESHGKGFTRYSHVGLGLTFLAYVFSSPGDFNEGGMCVGPTSPGETVIVAVEIPRNTPQVRMLVLTEDGLPIEEGREVDVLVECLPSWGSIEKGELRRKAGPGGMVSFRADQWPNIVAAGGGRMRVKITDGAPVMMAQVDVWAEEGQQDLDAGTLTLSSDCLLCKGVVLDAGGSPVVGARIALKGRRTVLAGDSKDRGAVPLGTALTGADGGFAIHGFSTGVSVAVVASKSGHLGSGLDDVPTGSSDVVITLGEAGQLTGSLRLSEGVDSTEFELGACRE